MIRTGRRRKRAHSGPARPLHETRWCPDTPVSVHGHATQCNFIHHAQGLCSLAACGLDQPDHHGPAWSGLNIPCLRDSFDCWRSRRTGSSDRGRAHRTRGPRARTSAGGATSTATPSPGMNSRAGLPWMATWCGGMREIADRRSTARRTSRRWHASSVRPGGWHRAPGGRRSASCGI